MAADEEFRHALSAVSAALEELAVPSMIIGGLAVIAAGVPRQTIDIDATVLGRTSDVRNTLEVFARHQIVSRIADAVTFARERQVLLLRHEPSGVPIEVSFAWLPFEEEALQNAYEINFQGVRLRVARAEDLIVYKIAAWRDRDRADIERLLVLHIEQINLFRVRDLVEQIGTALDDPLRLAAFDQMVARARIHDTS
jgi:predicted nucleotidyltransferase